MARTVNRRSKGAAPLGDLERLAAHGTGQSTANAGILRRGLSFIRLDTSHRRYGSAATLSTIARSGLNVAVFCMVFSITAYRIHCWVPLPESYGLRAKLQHLKSARDQYNVLFFGSSLIERGIIPELFDREMALRGYEVCSFNLGSPGMISHETNAYLTEVLRMGLPKLKWVFVEVTARRVPNKENRFTTRMIFWHTPEETWDLYRSISRMKMPVRDKLELYWTHLLHMLAKYTNLGEASRALHSLTSGDKRAKSEWVAQRDSSHTSR